MTPELYAAQTQAIQSLSQFFAGEAARLLADYAPISGVCSQYVNLCDELTTVTPANDANFAFRADSMQHCAQTYSALTTIITQDRLSALEYTGIEIDLELVRFYLFGREMVAAPKL